MPRVRGSLVAAIRKPQVLSEAHERVEHDVGDSKRLVTQRPPRVRSRTGLRKSRICHSRSSAILRRSLSGFTATGFPTASSIGRSVMESVYAYERERSMPTRDAICSIASAFLAPYA